jgi:hypothetical protein
VAAGSQGMGFWLAFPEHPTGLSANANISPRRTPLGEFSSNVAHSNDQRGLFVDEGPRPDGSTVSTLYDPRQNPADSRSNSVVTESKSFVGYKNRILGVWLRGRNQRIVAATLADNAIGATLAGRQLLDTEIAYCKTRSSWAKRRIRAIPLNGR